MSKSNEIRELIKNDLNKIIQTYTHHAVAYYLGFEATERNFTVEQKQRLQEVYGKETSGPTLYWRTLFPFIDNDSDYLIDEVVQDYLKAVRYEGDAFLLPRDRLKNMLWNKARNQVKQILDQWQ